MAWKAESKRHSIAKKYGRASSKKTAICPLSSSQVDTLSQVDFSKAPNEFLEDIVLDKTASKGAQDKAFDELARREHSEHPWSTIEQAKQIVNDHLAKVKFKTLERLKDTNKLIEFQELENKRRQLVAAQTGKDVQTTNKLIVEASNVCNKLEEMGAEWSNEQQRYILRDEEKRFMQHIIARG